MTQNKAYSRVSHRVNAFLDSDIIVRKCLLKNIISLRALSRYIIQKLELEQKNLDAVISAIRRYKKTGKEDAQEKILRRLFSGVAVKTRSEVVDIKINKNKKSLDGISRLNSIIDIEKGEIVRIIQAEQSITVVIDYKNLEKFYNIFGKSNYISVDKGLVEVNLQFTEEAQHVKGIIALVTSTLNAEGVNIVEIMSCAPELLLIVKKGELLKVLNVVNNISEYV